MHHVQPPSSSDDGDDLTDLPEQLRGLRAHGRGLSVSPSEPSGPAARDRPSRSPAASGAARTARAVAERAGSPPPFRHLQPAVARAEHWRSVEGILTSIEHDSAALVDRLASELREEHADGADGARVGADGTRVGANGSEWLGSELRGAYASGPSSLSPGRPSSTPARSRSRSPGSRPAVADVETTLAKLDREWSDAWDDLGASAAGRYGAMAARMAELEAELLALRTLAAHGARMRERVAAGGPRRAARLSAARVLSAWRGEASRSVRSRVRAERVLLRRATARMGSTRRRAWLALAGHARSERGAAERGDVVARRAAARIAHRTAVRVLHGWMGVARAARAPRAAVAQAARRVAHRLLWLAHAGWVSLVAKRRKARAMVVKVGRKLEARIVAAWRGLVAAHKSALEMSTRLLARALRRATAAGWDAWAEFAAERARAVGAARGAGARLRRRGTWRALARWAEAAAARTRARHLIGHAARRTIHRVEGSTFASWALVVRDGTRFARAAAYVVSRLRDRATAKALHSWITLADERARTGRLTAKFGVRWRNWREWAVWAAWAAHVETLRSARKEAATRFVRAARRETAGRLDAWREFVGQQRALRRMLARVVHRIAARALGAWAGQASRAAHARGAASRQGVRVLARMRQQLESRVFSALRAFVAHERRSRLIGARAAARWRFRFLGTVLRGWAASKVARRAREARAYALWRRGIFRLCGLCVAGWAQLVLARRERAATAQQLFVRALTGNVAAVLSGWRAAVLAAQHGRTSWIALLGRITISWRAYAHGRREARAQRRLYARLLDEGARALPVGALAGAPGALETRLRAEARYASPPRSAEQGAQLERSLAAVLTAARARRGSARDSEDDGALVRERWFGSDADSEGITRHERARARAGSAGSPHPTVSAAVSAADATRGARRRAGGSRGSTPATAPSRMAGASHASRVAAPLRASGLLRGDDEADEGEDEAETYAKPKRAWAPAPRERLASDSDESARAQPALRPSPPGAATTPAAARGVARFGRAGDRSSDEEHPTAVV
ncbi:hypothetical protein KFE25_004073 [Diacronema lutheri]|uniref:Sfi1 spindle body domain-containing protein n=1 Tax=Diacronema lutheri TaxID=2081491 RepID=A0A8J5XID6_DIALT|nr:hypothetical protein KFE25_004073 [Diacronema lutheri]